jgi:hypothetical protein
MSPWTRAQLATLVICSTFKAAGVECIGEKRRQAGCAPSQVAQAEAVRTGGDVLRNEPNFVFDQKGD